MTTDTAIRRGSFADWEQEFPEKVLVPARLCPVCFNRFIRHDEEMCFPCQQVRECDDPNCGCHEAAQ